jgi:hypothetical protein
MTTKKISYNPPEITYTQAMRLLHHNTSLLHCNPYVFAVEIERLVAASADPVSVRGDLVGHAYGFRVDRWSALLVLTQHGIRFDSVFTSPSE